MSELFKPMLSGRFDASVQRFPIFVSHKLDGIRCCAMDGKPMSRSMKVLPNKHLQAFFANNSLALQGLDGEIIVGPPNAKDAYRVTTSNVMSDDKEFAFTFWVFDRWADSDGFGDRLKRAQRQIDANYSSVASPVKMVPHTMIQNHAELEAYEADALDQGYEGVMIRNPDGLYKQGRSTTKSGDLLKVKRYSDAEAVIVGIEEEMHNGNEAERNELGRTKRSSAMAGLVGKGTMGALVVKGLNGDFKDVTFNIGTGFTAADRAADWPIGTVVTYTYFSVGVKDKPRHPVFKSVRDRMDFEAPAETIEATEIATPASMMPGYGAWA